MRDINSVRNDLRRVYLVKGNWRDVAGQYDISCGMAYRIVIHHYEPRRADIRAKLGLPAYISVPVCPIHNVVHLTKRCPAKRKPNPFKGYDIWILREK